MKGLALTLFTRVGLCACLVLLLVLAIDLKAERDLLVDQADQQARHQVEALGQVVDHYLRAASQLTDDLVAFQAPYGDDPAPKAFPFLVQLLDRTPDRSAFGIYLAFEKPDASSDPVIVWVNRNSLPAQAHLEYDFHEPQFLWYQDAKQNPDELIVTEPYYDKGASNIAMISLTRAIRDRQGKFTGVAGTDLSLDEIRSTVLAAQSEIGYGDGYFYLVSRAGRVIAHPDSRLQVSKTSQGSQLSELPEGSKVKGAQGSDQIEVDGKVRRIYWAEVSPESGWMVVCNLPEEAILAPLVPFVKQGLGLIALSMLLTLATVALIGLRISQSVSQLTEAADSARRGDYGGRSLSAPARRPDELGRLARSFLNLFNELGQREERLRETQRELRVREENFKWLLESSFSLLAVLAPDGTILSYTSRLIPHAPTRLEDLLVSADRESYHRLWTGQVRGSLEVRLQSEPDLSFELTLQDRLEDPSVQGIVVSLRDVTERKQSQEAELEREAAQAASEAKSAFLATMSHELRTPLNAVVGYSEMLIEDAEDRGEKAVVADLNKILGAAKHLLALISDILDLSKVEAGRMEVSLEMFEVDPVLDNVIATIQPLVAKNRNSLVIERQPSLGRMRSDLTKLRQSLFNLLSNACKFTENGKVTLRARTEGPDWLSFEVADDGIGMTPEQLSRLFQAFSQADDSTSRKYGGTGLGLMLTRNFCRMLGGDVSVLSRAGEGTTFTIRLPRHTQEAVPLSEVEKTRPPSRAGRGSVLIIDDNADAREILSRSLEKAGYEIRQAASGAEGLALARVSRPSLITLDIMMPEMDGTRVLEELRQDPSLADVPVLLISIRADREMALTLGASGFLTKPVDRDQLLRAVARLAPAGRSCLVVDDDPDARGLLVRYLEGWDVREAPDGLAALGLLRARKADLILLDLVMPRMDGFELQRMLRDSDDPSLAKIPIIVISSKDLTPEEIQELEGAERPVLRKGFRPEELVRLMDTMFPGKDDSDEHA